MCLCSVSWNSGLWPPPVFSKYSLMICLMILMELLCMSGSATKYTWKTWVLNQIHQWVQYISKVYFGAVHGDTPLIPAEMGRSLWVLSLPGPYREILSTNSKQTKQWVFRWVCCYCQPGRGNQDILHWFTVAGRWFSGCEHLLSSMRTLVLSPHSHQRWA